MLVVGANVVVFWALANAAAEGRLDLGTLVIFAQSAVGTSMIAFGGLNWALDGAAAPVAGATVPGAPGAAVPGAAVFGAGAVWVGTAGVTGGGGRNFSNKY